jgi:hypothetical protein
VFRIFYFQQVNLSGLCRVAQLCLCGVLICRAYLSASIEGEMWYSAAVRQFEE